MSDPTVPLVSGAPEPSGAAEQEPGSAPPRHPARLNALAVAALILGVLLSPLAALFGHIAAVQIALSGGRERGLALAWVAVGLGYLWLAGLIVIAVAIGVVLAS